jgi:hypothetical protein
MATLISRINDVVTNIGTDIKTLFSLAIPAGGATGQVLTKSSGTDYATSWQTPAAGGGGTSTLDGGNALSVYGGSVVVNGGNANG